MADIIPMLMPGTQFYLFTPSTINRSPSSAEYRQTIEERQDVMIDAPYSKGQQALRFGPTFEEGMQIELQGIFYWLHFAVGQELMKR